MRSSKQWLCLLVLGRVGTWWATLLVSVQTRNVESWSFQTAWQPGNVMGNFRHSRSPWQLLRVHKAVTTTTTTTTKRSSSSLSMTSNVAVAPAIELHAVAYSGLNKKEFQIIQEMVETACWEGIGLSVTCNSSDINPKLQQETPTKSPRIIGALGRVLLLHTNLDDESIENIEYAIGEQMDSLLYSEPPLLTQPVLVKLQNPTFPTYNNSLTSASTGESLKLLIEQELDMYEMNKPIVEENVGSDRKSTKGACCPSIHVELDAAEVTDAHSSTTWWDTSTLLVFDDLVNDDLRKRLLQTTLGPNARHWNDIEKGPDPGRWVRGGLMDTAGGDDEEGESAAIDATTPMSCWGLKDEAVEDVCFNQHDAIDEFERILSEEVFPQFVVSRLPEAVFGACVSPLTANAPTHDDHFDYHIDGDPNLTPPSPWTDIYGRYPNRLNGKPRFMSCLVYLNDEWDADEFGAPTRFLDLPTDEHYDVLPKPGRCIIMDQDLSHTVVAPKASAGKRPRYSIVWKLILHPKEDLQDMTDLAGDDREWPKPLLFGSAKSPASL